MPHRVKLNLELSGQKFPAKKITITNPPPADQSCFDHAQRRRLRRVLNIEICDLFEIWCLGFGVCRTIMNPNAFYPARRINAH
jgi:hypothetical protein